jgi:xanthine dehydrogenase accessory factor
VTEEPTHGVIDVLAEAGALRAAGRPFVLATVVWRRAPTSGRVGAKAIVLPDGSVLGFIGGACAEPTLVREARDALADGRPRLLFLGPLDELDGVLREGIVRVPMACESEGALEIYLEPMVPSPRVLAVGRSPLALTLAVLARDLGWSADVVDELPDRMQADERTAVVVATQGRFDEAAVQAALATDAGYVGLVASRRRSAAVIEWLREAGVSGDALARLRSPAGVDLGAVEHSEIAVAVLAELVALHAAGGLRAADVVATVTAEATDAVCGMTVTVAGAHHVSEWKGAWFYFCAAGCKRSFDADPEKYAAALA